MDMSYSTETSTDTPAQSSDTGEKPMDGEMEEEHETSALLPKSILAGKDFKVGEEVVLKIVAMHDDEIEVEYATGEAKKDEGSTMDQAKAGLDRYAKEPQEM